MTPSELLIAAALLLTCLSGALLALVLWLKRPRYRRGRRGRTVLVSVNPSAPPAHYPSRPDEGSLLSSRPPRMTADEGSVPVADVEDDSWVGGAEVLQRATR